MPHEARAFQTNMIFLTCVMILLELSNGSPRNFEASERLTVPPQRFVRPVSISSHDMFFPAQQRQTSRRIDKNDTSNSGYWQYYQNFLKKATRNLTELERNNTHKKSFSSLLGSLPSYLSFGSGIKRYPINPAALSAVFLQYGNTNDDEADSDEVEVPSSFGPTSRRPMLPIVNGPSWESDEDGSDRRKVPLRDPLKKPSSDTKWQQAQQQIYANPVHDRPKPEDQSQGWSPALPSAQTPIASTTSATIQDPLLTLASRPMTNAAYEGGSAGKLPDLSYRRPYYPSPPLLPPSVPPPAPVLPIVGGSPAKVVNPYINIAFSPQMSLLGMRIQKNFGLHLGIKIVRPVRRPFAFLTPLIGGAISPAAPPANFIPLANPQPVQPPPYYQYQGPLSGAVEQDIVISRKSGDLRIPSGQGSKEEQKLSFLDKLRLKRPLTGVEGRG